MITKAKNLWFIIFTAILMAACIAVLPPFGSALAADGEGVAATNGTKHSAAFSIGHSNATEITADYFTDDAKYTLQSGSYYLGGNVNALKPLTVTGEVTLCLNGYKLEYVGSQEGGALIVTADGALTICDCNLTHSLHGYETIGGKYEFDDDATETVVRGGVIAGGDSVISVNGGSLEIYAGTVAGGECGVSLSGDAHMTVVGGLIAGNSDCNVDVLRGVLTVTGGEISSSQIGIRVMLGDVVSGVASKLEGGTVKDCAIGVSVEGFFELSGGTIKDCTTGVSVDYGRNESLFTVSGGEISHNETGVFSDGTVEIGGGLIGYNTVGVVVNSGRIVLTGSPVVSGNADLAGTKSNLVLMNGVAEIDGVLGEDTLVGVTVYGNMIGSLLGAKFTYGFTRGGNTGDPTTMFYADGYNSIVLGRDGEVYVGERNIATLWFTGEGEPNIFTQDGDLYLDTETGDVYRYNGNAVSWTKIANLTGIGIDGADGSDGKSAYDIAVENGFEGTEQEWLESLKGVDGIDGNDGADGADGTNGRNGKDGKDSNIGLVTAALAIACVSVVIALAMGVYVASIKKRNGGK